MSFQITTKEGEPITINDLDREACALWNRPYDEKHYVKPKEQEYYAHWFDMVGLYIHCQRSKEERRKRVDWSDVLGLMMGHLLLEKDAEKVKISIEAYWQPYIDLIRHWKSKEYRAIAVSE